MLFNSIPFIFVFLPITAIVYYFLLSKRVIIAAKIWLVATSLAFYSYWNIYYLPLILISVSFNFALGTLISDISTNKIIAKHLNKRSLLIFGIFVNTAALAYFKYADFLIDNFNYITSMEISHLNIVLPLAISFFTFQQIAYLVDSYRGYTKEYDFLTYTLFVSFFPQLIAGPIVSHNEMIPQFYQNKNLVKNYKNIFQGVIIFLIGLFKKVVIADTFAQYATLGFDKIDNLTLIGGWFTSISYTIQIYFDFSGYCDMAIGAALFFNIRLPLNFDSPYKALNIQDFWRRWHMTLSRFLRDYIYIPLGGNKKGEIRTYTNIITVFLIGGLWHGAAWTFIVWGALHGIANTIYRLWKRFGLHMNKAFAWFIMFNFINISWIFFRAENFKSAMKVLRAMVDFSSLANLPAFRSKYYLAGFGCHSSTLLCAIAIIILTVFLQNSYKLTNKCVITSQKQALFYGWGIALFSLFLILKMLVVPYSEFIYFNF